MIAALPRRSSPGVDAQVRNERIRLLYRHAATTVTASVAVAGLLLGLMWPRVARSDAVAWLTTFALVTALRYVMLLAHARWQERYSAKQWERAFTIGALLAGCAWGMSALWLFPLNDLPYQFFVVIVGMGLAAGAASSLSASPVAYFAFLFPTVLPPSMRILFESGTLPHVAGIAAIVYCLAMVAVGLNNARMMTTALRLRFANLELAQELEALATRDSLTGLPNRLILVERLMSALKRADRGEHDVAVAFLDCDGFKKINDTYGHQAGDEYLQHVAAMLQNCVREVDTVARLGGDEFILLLERCGDKETVERIVLRILGAARQEIRVGNAAVLPRFSMGVSCYPRDGTDPETLIQQADEAMYAAKRAGGNDFRFYAPPLSLQA
jgi:diguanylate cyclase (GGDEF)-like protein